MAETAHPSDIGGISIRKRIWGWYFFDWASQPYNTLMLTFIFGPYFAQTAAAQLMAGGMSQSQAAAQAQAWWGYGLTATGVTIAVLAPLLGSVADSTGRRMPWIWLFSICYAVGAFGVWFSAPDAFNPVIVLIFFGIGMIGMEFATIFTNSYLPSMGPKKELGRISGSGWAFGYVGGFVALVIMLMLFQAGSNGKTMAGLTPLFGLDTETRADTRIVGPLTGMWFVVFMIPFFLWVRDEQTEPRLTYRFGKGVSDLIRTLVNLPGNPSLLAYLGSSMFYRDALNGMYTFGGIYAAGVLGWSITQIGIFGIAAVLSGAIFCWIAGYIDRAVGPKPVIVWCCLLMMLTALFIISLTPTSVLWMPVVDGSSLPDQMFYLAGIVIGAAGGILQSSSRNMLTRQGNPERMTEAFGLYALSGKATSFLAPAMIAIVSDITGDQRLGVTPLVFLFGLGLFLLLWVKPDGEHSA